MGTYITDLKSGKITYYNWTATTGTYKQCKHENGWYDNIKFLCFNIKVFICTDCSNIIYSKKLKKMIKTK